MTTKKVFSAVDAHPTVLHAKRDADSEIAYPIIVDSDGRLLISQGLVSETYDYICVSYSSGNISNVIYKSGGSGGVTVANLDITYSSGNISTITRT